MTGVAKEAGKLYATGRVITGLGGDDDKPPPSDDGPLEDELQKEARERAAEARAIGATQMYRDNMRALNPMLRSHV